MSKTGPTLAKSNNNMWRCSKYISMTHFRTSPPCFLLPGNPNSLRFLATKMPKLNQYRPKLNYFWTWSGYISMPHFGPFLSCILLTMPWNLNFKFLFINRSKLGLHRPKSNHFWIQQHAKFLVIPSMRSTKKCTDSSPDGRRDEQTLTDAISPYDFVGVDSEVASYGDSILHCCNR